MSDRTAVHSRLTTLSSRRCAGEFSGCEVFQTGAVSPGGRLKLDD